MKYKPGDMVDYDRGDMITTEHRVLKTAENYVGYQSISGVDEPVLETALNYTKGVRRALPMDRKGYDHSFYINGLEVTITTGEYEDGRLGEIFITVGKEGGPWRAYDGMAIVMSIALQYGIPGILETFIDKFEHVRMEPAGITTDQDIAIAKSIFDYLARWLKKTYLPRESKNEFLQQPTD